MSYYKETNTELIYISSDDDESSVEMTEEDKTLILGLMTTEYCREMQESDNVGHYRCKQKCTICSENKPNFPTDENLLYELFVQRGEVIFLSKEDREGINRDLVHHFFKQKWEARNEKRESAGDETRTESNQSKGKKEHNQNIKSINEKQKNHEFHFVTQSISHYDKHHEEEANGIEKMETARDETPNESNQSTGKKKHDQNIKSINEKQKNHEFNVVTKSISRYDKHHEEGANGIEKMETARDETRAKQDHKTASISSTESIRNLRLESITAEMQPMNDPKGPFFIDKEFVDVEMYEHGIQYDHWNPTQSLYEISSKCNWGKPLYTVTRLDEKTIFPRFMCEVVVNGKSFMSDKCVTNKKTAQHLASAKFLKCIGFKFQYTPDKEGLKIPITRNENRSASKRMIINKPFPYGRLRSDDRSLVCYDGYERSSGFRRNKETKWQKSYSLSIEQFKR